MQDESLSDYVTCLQQLVTQSYAKEASEIKRKRVIWRVLTSLHSGAVRSQLIKENWTANDKEAKSHDEILNIATTTLSHQ